MIAMRVRVFLNWSMRHGRLPTGLAIPPARSAMPAASDSSHRWEIARRLVQDETIRNSDRVLGARIVLYAQPLTRIVQLTTADVRRDDNDVVTITLGPVVIEIPEPFAGLALQLPERRRDGMNDQIPTTWLFPGNTANRHTTVNTMSTRLRRLDISPREMRSAALGQLAAEIPPAILATTVGITATTAARWAAIAGGDWTRYAGRRIEPGASPAASAQTVLRPHRDAGRVA